ncbi:hypothetical protein KFK09_016542 [Dendrobium nobile]|uniref:Retrovirus-related Pol polyprotein from transposon TNT 1-94-like beta-barrel domain-containing protein n=1 Tax=Dendrobium nobile TaxID=94219 RepID=A0A8T3AZN2_DENNO|nr:hypothetical protein KFK09_016542 [Dendrobium nobile]
MVVGNPIRKLNTKFVERVVILLSHAAAHLMSNGAQLFNQQLYIGSTQIQIGNGQMMQIQPTGQGILPSTGKLHLSHILHVPNLTHNLISINKLTSNNSCYVILDANDFFLEDSLTHKMLLHGHSHRGLYPIKPQLCFISLTIHIFNDAYNICLCCSLLRSIFFVGYMAPAAWSSSLLHL